MQIQKTLIVSGLLLCGLIVGTPRVSSAASGCSNMFLNGTYNIEVENSSIVNVLATLRAVQTANGSTTVTLPPPPTGGFGNNVNSLGGQVPGLGRFYFDGNGNITGQMTTTSGSVINTGVGSYTVNFDCTATMRLNSGESFNAIVGDSGNHALFMGTDGVLGTMRRSNNSCVQNLGSQQSFAFSVSGAQRRAGASGSTTGTTTTSINFDPYSSIGSVTLNPDGSFTFRGWTFANGSTQSVTTNGTYTIGLDCSLRLNGAAVSSGSPLSLRGLLIDQQTGVISIQADSSNTLTGQFVVQ
jgi:hypothetical protein